MSENICSYQDNRDETIVAYLYDDVGGVERARFERHLSACAVCREELRELRAVRRDLAAWSPPDLGEIVSRRQPQADSAPAPVVHGRFGWAREMPAWAQAAAAVLCLGVGAGLANLQVTYNSDGVSVRTGWKSGASAAPAAGATQVAQTATRAELAALEERIRSEVQAAEQRAASVPAAADISSATSDEEILRRVRALIRDSEQRQQREFALRLADEARERQTQRQADLMKIDRTLGVLSSNTGLAVRRQEQLLNSLAVRVSQRQ